MIVTAATPSSPKYFIIIMLNKNVVIPVDNSVSISLLPFVQDFKRTFQVKVGFEELMGLDEGRKGKKIIREGDFQANYAYYCLHRLGILPSQFMTMSLREKAFVIGAIDLKLEKEGR